MKKILLAFGLLALSLAASKPAQAGVGVSYGSVAVSSFTYTAMASTTTMDGAYGINLCNESSTGTIRCGYDVNVSTVAGATYLGFPVLKGTCVYRGVSNMVYCKSEVAAQTTPATLEVFK